MAKDPRFRKDGQPDGRGHGAGSKKTRFAEEDGRRRPGRPKGSKSLKTVYLAAADITVRAVINGKTKRITSKEAMILKEREQAMGGDHRAREHFLKRLDEYSPIEVQPDLTVSLIAEDEVIIADVFKRGVFGIQPLPRAGGENDDGPDSNPPGESE